MERNSRAENSTLCRSSQTLGSCPVGDGQEPGSEGNWDEEGDAETPEEETGAAPKCLLFFLSLTLGLMSHDPPRAVISSAVIGPLNYGIIIF